MRTLVIAECSNNQVAASTLNTLKAATEIMDVTDVLIFASNQTNDLTLQKTVGVNKIIVAQHNSFEHPLAENMAPIVAALSKDYTHILAPATTFGKNLMPRVAALCDVMQISDIVTIVDDSTFVRPIYASNALQTVRSSDAIKVITIRPTAFEAAVSHDQLAKIEHYNQNITIDPRVCFKRAEFPTLKRPELTQAKVIVSGGRGLKSKDSFHLIENLADKLGAAIGATRAAVDAGFVPNDYQVGQTGKVVAPTLYIAVGISGAIQHQAGMKESKIIVAINQDSEAPIFEIADYGLVGDLFKILPELIEQL